MERTTIALVCIASFLVACGDQDVSVEGLDASTLYDACSHRAMGVVDAEHGIFVLDDGTVIDRERAIEVPPGSPEVQPECDVHPGLGVQAMIVTTGSKSCLYDHSAIEGGGWVYETICYDSATGDIYVSTTVTN